mmetsp:Transcript_14149/g.33016  ORF Transcript_14149/g.33016 Transcript_14149/m.33016 type:complete len:328 (-) Transcript_14149:48-1031(-)|eukprot:CAMPEP_0114551904 /NCGR_PEP_ID=MMETSP0114-20121206/6846_1 /TAXON_ID=31324 /ORGANISM="Goniomonas sp, Strain m" /LENGTH=327 /DNA_ID=CAMNT_0001736757 /DNA_START=93 /DNA_END=1076 /DNA_ORIENTATION=-
MQLVLALACLALATALPLSTEPLSEDQYQYLYGIWAKQHNKIADPERLPAFKANVDFVHKHNQEYQLGLHHYKTALNRFADLTNKEFRAFYTGFKFVPRNDTMENALLLTGEAPDSVDWRTKGVVTPVKNQQQCGSCWSFSATGSLEGAYAIKTGKLVSFSEQELVDCDKTDSGCGGGLMDNAFDWIQQNGGIDTEADYPYTAMDGRCDASKKAKHVGTVSGHVDVPSNNEEQLKLAVAKGPVSVAIEADQSAFQMYSGGVFSGTCGTQLDHGVLVVGYGTEGGKDYWIVKNSWGANWGDSGYILLERGKGGAGQCGIAMQPSYPLV